MLEWKEVTRNPYLLGGLLHYSGSGRSSIITYHAELKRKLVDFKSQDHAVARVGRSTAGHQGGPPHPTRRRQAGPGMAARLPLVLLSSSHHKMLLLSAASLSLLLLPARAVPFSLFGPNEALVGRSELEASASCDSSRNGTNVDIFQTYIITGKRKWISRVGR